jgi:hypothetical protein
MNQRERRRNAKLKVMADLEQHDEKPPKAEKPTAAEPPKSEPIIVKNSFNSASRFS